MGGGHQQKVLFPKKKKKKKQKFKFKIDILWTCYWKI
jgi:hypothetical protein